MRIIPAIDLYDNHCVRLTEGSYDSMVRYDSDPVSAAARFIESGFHFLHVVDLEGAKLGRPVHLDVVRKIASIPKSDVQIGGGIRCIEDVQNVLDAGARRVITGSVAVRTPEILAEWVSQFGAKSFCVAVDVKGSTVLTSAWQSSSGISAEKIIEFTLSLGIVDFVCTDVSKDGKLQGPNIELYRELKKTFPQMKMIASGGIASIDDLQALNDTGVSAAIVGKALYEKRIMIDDLRSFLK